MNCSHAPFATPLPASAPRLALRPQTLVTRLRAVLCAWQHHRRSLRDLRALDDRMLRDIGLTRSQIETPTGPPFWRI